MYGRPHAKHLDTKRIIPSRDDELRDSLVLDNLLPNSLEGVKQIVVVSPFTVERTRY